MLAPAIRSTDFDATVRPSFNNLKFVRETKMLNLAITLLVLALIAAVLGFGGIAGSMVGIAKILFYVFIVLFLISAVVSALQGRAPV